MRIQTSPSPTRDRECETLFHPLPLPELLLLPHADIAGRPPGRAGRPGGRGDSSGMNAGSLIISDTFFRPALRTEELRDTLQSHGREYTYLPVSKPDVGPSLFNPTSRLFDRP